MASRMYRQLILIFTASLLCLDYAAGFVLHKRRAENNLKQALKVIERQKRHVLFEENDRESWPDTNQPFYDWETRQYPDFDDERRYEDTFDIPALSDLYASRYRVEEPPSLASPQSGPYDWSAIFDRDQDDDLEEINTGSEAVSQEELRDIFGGPADNEIDKKSNVDEGILGKRNPEYDPSHEAQKRGYSVDDGERGLSKEEVESLLNGANLDFDEGMDDESPDSDASAVSQDEIQEMFKNMGDSAGDSEVDATDDSSKGDNGQIMFIPTAPVGNAGEDSESDTSEQLPEIPQEEEDLFQEQPPSVHGSIAKRSNWDPYPRSMREDMLNGDDSEGGYEVDVTVEGLANELAITRADVKILKNFLALEDEENANLAKALNLATKSQTERTDKYMQEEIDYIKDAIEDEMDLKEIREVLQIASSLKDATDNDEPTEDDLDLSPLPLPQEDYYVAKRGFPEEDDLPIGIPVGALDEDVPPVDEEEDDEAPLDITGEDIVNILLVTKLKEILSQAKEDELDRPISKEEAIQAWYNMPGLPGAATEEDTEYYMNPLTRELLEKLREQETAKNSLEFQDPLPAGYFGDFDGIQALDECPAVDDLTDNCAFMQALGLSLDEEATDLCNRHRMCYTCGAAMGLSPNDCDRGYLAESSVLCEDEGGCDQDAAGLFILMLKNHDFLPISRVPDECADSCVTDYIANESTSRRRK